MAEFSGASQSALKAAFGWLILLGLFGEPIFHLWLRGRVVYSTSLILLMLASLIPFAIANSFSILLSANYKIHRVVVWLLPAALGLLAVTAAGGRLLGLNGAALGLLAFETLILLVVCSVAAKHTQVEVLGTLAAAVSKQSVSTTYKSALSALRFTRAELP